MLSLRGCTGASREAGGARANPLLNSFFRVCAMWGFYLPGEYEVKKEGIVFLEGNAPLAETCMLWP